MRACRAFISAHILFSFVHHILGAPGVVMHQYDRWYITPVGHIQYKVQQVFRRHIIWTHRNLTHHKHTYQEHILLGAHEAHQNINSINAQFNLWLAHELNQHKSIEFICRTQAPVVEAHLAQHYWTHTKHILKNIFICLGCSCLK